MGKFSKEIQAYALRNAIEFGKADVERVLPKLFQHGLDRGDVKNVISEVQEVVKSVNKLSEEERIKDFSKYENIVRVREERDGLAELPNAKVGKVVLRAAPFPSGALHLGNAKTFILNSLYAEKYKGKLILVIDDTIGSAEKPIEEEAYDLIKDSFKFLKIKHGKIVYKSDRLDIYYRYAKKLIEKNKAYVCHCTQTEVRENRAVGKACSCRVYPVMLQLKRWKEMFKMKEGKATLRIKTSMQDSNPAFRDRVLFKISDREHARIGKKYRIWPTLEMSWSIDDHLLGITHIIRGNDLMIESDMEKYIWKIFSWDAPEIIHTGLVHVEGIKLAKSKSRKEVKSGKFLGWDDPRTWSIQSLARRGISALVIRKFVEEIGLNKQNVIVPIETLFALNRRLIDKDADRYSFVVNPVMLNIEKRPGWKSVGIPVHPDKAKMREVKLGDVYISRTDFDQLKGKEVRLLHLYNIDLDKKCKVTDIDGLIENKVNWVSDYVPGRVLMADGKWVDGYVDSNVNKLKIGSVIQFERFGFVRFDGVKKINEKNVYEFWFGHK
jgi:glutamyl-tRNA synthetase